MIDTATESAVRALFPLLPKAAGESLVRAALADSVPRSEEFRAWAADALAGRVKRKAGQGRPQGSLNPIAARAAVETVREELKRSRRRHVTIGEAVAHIIRCGIRIEGRKFVANPKRPDAIPAPLARAMRVNSLPGIKPRPVPAFAAWVEGFTLRQADLRRLRMAGAMKDSEFRRLVGELNAPAGRRRRASR